MSGTGTGAVYERDTGVFRVLADAHMITTSAPGETSGHVDATAQTMTFNRVGNALLFDTQARIVHDTDAMSADRATLYLTPDHEQFRVIELRGSSRVQPAPGQTSSAPDMQAQDIDLAFYEGTQVLQRAVLNGQARMVMIDGASRRAISGAMVMLTTAPDGKTVTHLEASDRVVVNTPAQNGAPQRTITAPSLVANGDDQHGLTSAQFTGGVRFVETTPGAGGRGGTSGSTVRGDGLPGRTVPDPTRLAYHGRMRIMVVGASSGTGKLVLDEAVRRGHDVVAVSRRGAGRDDERQGHEYLTQPHRFPR